MELDEGLASEAFQTHYFLPCESVHTGQRNPEFVRVDVFLFEFTNSSDGIVPYWSSHLDGAKSELIVHSGHGAQYDPEAIREVERILKENLTDKN